MSIGENIGCNVGENTGSSGRRFANIVPSGDWQLAAGHYEAEQIPMEVINPQMGLLPIGDLAKSYYYRCYPGIEWKVPISVLGGAPPFYFEIADADGLTGLTIGQKYGDANYGLLSCPSPTVGTYVLSINVYDQDPLGHRTVPINLTWTLTVTTANAVFVDATNGLDTNGGLTVGDAKQTIGGWYGNSYGFSPFEGYHVYYKAGTYQVLPTVDYDPSRVATTGACQMRSQPLTHIAYDNEAAILDFDDGILGVDGGMGSIRWEFTNMGSTDDDIFIGNGLKLDNVGGNTTDSTQAGVMFGNGNDRITVSDCELGANHTGQTGGNPSWFFTVKNSGFPNSLYHSYHNITAPLLDNYLLVEMYDTEKVVIQDCDIIGISGVSRLTYEKVDTSLVSVRFNKLRNASLGLVDSSQGTTGEAYDQIEYCYNDCDGVSAYQLRFGNGGIIDIGRMYVYRNTLTGGEIQLADNTGGGPVWFQDNVRQTVNGDGINEGTSPITYSGDSTDLVASSGLVDAGTNLLTGTNRTTYLGTKGHEVE